MEVPNFKFAIFDYVTNSCKGTEFKPEDFLPKRSNPADTGFDLRCSEKNGIKLYPGCYFKCPLGIKVIAPDGWWLKLEPRSSTFTKRHINSLCGIVDNSYELEMYYCGVYLPDQEKENNIRVIGFGERVCQIIPFKLQDMNVNSVSVEEFDALSKEKGTNREGGFGSSGTK